MTSPNKPGAALWASVLAVALVGYLLSVWPAVWIGSRWPVMAPVLSACAPLVVVERHFPESWQVRIARFLSSATPPHRVLIINGWTIAVRDIPV
jgi:hypothetical protein